MINRLSDGQFLLERRDNESLHQKRHRNFINISSQKTSELVTSMRSLEREIKRIGTKTTDATA